MFDLHLNKFKLANISKAIKIQCDIIVNKAKIGYFIC